MFFCVNLVFATSNTRVIQENNTPDIIVNVKSEDYVISNAVLHPITKNNILTYIVKDNVSVSFSIGNHEIDTTQVLLHNYYYRYFKNKSIKIRSYDRFYIGGTEVKIMPDIAYNVLKATNRLDGCIFIFGIDYKVIENGESKDKFLEIPFMIVSNKEYDMYEEMEKAPDIKEENGNIRKPRKS